MQGHAVEGSGYPSVMFLHAYQIKLHQLETSNVIMTSDASTHQINIRECNFNGSKLNVKANNIILTATSTLDAHQNTASTGLRFEVQSSLEFQTCSLPTLTVLCLSVNCSTIVNSSNITAFKQPIHFMSNSSVVIQNSVIVGGIQINGSPCTDSRPYGVWCPNLHSRSVKQISCVSTVCSRVYHSQTKNQRGN